MAGIASRKLESKLWSEETVRKEQLRATIAIAAIAACYYSMNFISEKTWVGQLLRVCGVLLVIFWGAYLMFISAATVSDLRIALLRALFDENICRSLAGCAHVFYGIGVVLLLVIIFFFSMDQLPSVADWFYGIVTGSFLTTMSSAIAVWAYFAFRILPRLENLNRRLGRQRP
jgi:hypothetical protein